MNARAIIEAETPKKIFRRIVALTKRVPGPEAVRYGLEADWEQDDPKGHFDDPEDVAFVREQIRAGNVWGWCSTHVTASWTDEDGNEYTGNDYLGGCSYRSRADFMQPGGYYDDMKSGAYADLVAQLERAGFQKY